MNSNCPKNGQSKDQRFVQNTMENWDEKSKQLPNLANGQGIIIWSN